MPLADPENVAEVALTESAAEPEATVDIMLAEPVLAKLEPAVNAVHTGPEAAADLVLAEPEPAADPVLAELQPAADIVFVEPEAAACTVLADPETANPVVSSKPAVAKKPKQTFYLAVSVLVWKYIQKCCSLQIEDITNGFDVKLDIKKDHKNDQLIIDGFEHDYLTER